MVFVIINEDWTMCNSSKPTSSIRSVLKRASCIVGVGVALAAFSQGAAASCSYVVNNQWGSGFTASINITNSTSSTINGWNVSWQYNNNRVTNSWNAKSNNALYSQIINQIMYLYS